MLHSVADPAAWIICVVLYWMKRNVLFFPLQTTKGWQRVVRACINVVC